MEFCVIPLNLIALAQVLLTVWVVRWFAKQPRGWLNAALASIALAAVAAVCIIIGLFGNHFLECNACGDMTNSSVDRSVFQTAFAVATLFFIPATFFFWTFNDKDSPSVAETEKYWLLFGLFLSLLTCFFVLYGVPQFAELFESFGANLPSQTVILLNYYRWVALLPLLVLGTWFTKHEHRGGMAASVGVAGSVIVMTYALWSVYSPVFVVGCAI
ncbi:MAG: hypothetical protein PHI11_01365 [Gallionella sp.]|nr:hypothetical protein [Gallionella sp.]